ncbi:MAG TPA: glycosyltransferase family 4 protein [Anaerolineales bacterium]|nr:glycosyltransferase family 4 protein [Anaerolineales bacterium]
MHILISLMYYRPHYSGLTIYTERLARALVARGHQVTVLTSRFDPQLPFKDVQDGVTIIRPWVLMRISKGVVMPAMPYWAWRLIYQADVVNAHVPQPDAALIALIGRFLKKPVTLTYHCDLRLPTGLIHYLANQGSHLTNHIAASLADVIVTNTQDYAEHSPFLVHYLRKIIAIPPPIELSAITADDLAAFRARNDIQDGQRIIGMAARLATEKGVEYLVEAMPEVLKAHPNSRVLFAGQHLGVLGEELYAQKLAPLIEDLGGHWSYLGVLPPKEWAAFFHSAEVTVLPSINSTESFGMVQVEAMTCGKPVIASDLPGVRQPVLSTRMGVVVPPADAQALSRALIGILDHPNGFQGDPVAVRKRFAPDSIAEEYEQLFLSLIEARGKRSGN